MIKRNRKTKSQLIADRIRRELSMLRTYRGMPAASAAELSREYNVSKPTAHRALKILVEEGLLYRIPGSGTFFQRDNPGRILRIGIADQAVSPEYLSADVNRILNYHFDYAAEYFRNNNCEVTIISYAELMSQDILLHLDGLLISIMDMDSRSVPLLLSSKLPVLVYRSDYIEKFPFPSLVYDLDTGMQEALNYLNPENDRIIVIAEITPSGQHAKERWLHNLSLSGVPDSLIAVYDINVFEREISCYRLVRVNSRLFENAIILTCNDELAMSLANALNLEGLVCGRDYRLVGIGNREAYGFTAIEKLQISSIETPIQQMAQEAARQLLFQLEKHSECNWNLMIPTHFIRRTSTG